MWPKILIELVPHLTRLVPMADRYLTTRTASEKTQEAALAALGDQVRRELGRVGEIHVAMQVQMHAQSAQLAEVASDAARARTAAESMEARVAGLDGAAAQTKRLLVAVVVLTTAAIVLLAVVLVRLRAH
jgi:hypothetical protein